MTIRELFAQRLDNCMMFPDDIKTILTLHEQDPAMSSMAGRWDDATEGYDESTLLTIWMNFQQTALKWIDANQPQAFYRSFVEKA